MNKKLIIVIAIAAVILMIVGYLLFNQKKKTAAAVQVAVGNAGTTVADFVPKPGASMTATQQEQAIQESMNYITDPKNTTWYNQYQAKKQANAQEAARAIQSAIQGTHPSALAVKLKAETERINAIYAVDLKNWVRSKARQRLIDAGYKITIP